MWFNVQNENRPTLTNLLVWPALMFSTIIAGIQVIGQSHKLDLEVADTSPASPNVVAQKAKIKYPFLPLQYIGITGVL